MRWGLANKLRANSETVLLVDLLAMRKAADKSMCEVARDIGVTDVTIRNIEAGHGVTLETAMKIAKYYDLGISDIWKLKGE